MDAAVSYSRGFAEPLGGFFDGRRRAVRGPCESGADVCSVQYEHCPSQFRPLRPLRCSALSRHSVGFVIGFYTRWGGEAFTRALRRTSMGFTARRSGTVQQPVRQLIIYTA